MNKKNLLFLILIITITLIIGTLFYAFLDKNKYINKIEKEMQGVRISKDTLEVQENVTLIINGNIEKYNDGFTFMGELFISNLEYLKGITSFLVYNKSHTENEIIEGGIISYVRNVMVNNRAIPDYATIHWVNTDSNFSYMVLANFDDDCINNSFENSTRVYNGNDILVFPATDTESALKLLKELEINKKVFQKSTIEDNINSAP